MNAKKAVFDTWRLEDLGLAPEEAGKAGSATAVAGVFAPEKHTVGIMIEGADEKAAIAELFKNWPPTISYKEGIVNGYQTKCLGIY